jgi:hypothetical protein
VSAEVLQVEAIRRHLAEYDAAVERNAAL